MNTLNWEVSMGKKEHKHYLITYHFTDAKEDFSKLLEYHFLSFIRKLQKK